MTALPKVQNSIMSSKLEEMRKNKNGIKSTTLQGLFKDQEAINCQVCMLPFVLVPDYFANLCYKPFLQVW